jgi:tRNA threonylcarbamoyladenosine biosynthesis protein TsaB
VSQSGYPLILAIETATPSCSVAITEGGQQGGRVLAALTLCGTVTHSQRLLTRIGQLLEETAVTWSMLDGVAVSIGPGSFTGLRIGMATAKGLAFAGNRPLLGVSTLTSLASSCSSAKKICAALDARKKQVYAAFFRRSPSGRLEQNTATVVVVPEQLAAGIGEPVYMVGDAVAVYGEYWREVLGDRYEAAPAQLHLPSAASLGLIAAEQLQRGELLHPGLAVPLYVRASEAELNLAATGTGRLPQRGTIQP